MTMRAMLVREPAPYSSNISPLELAEVPIPSVGHDELLVRVSVCGVCRTDLDVVEGRLTAPRYPVIPGHQVIGRVAEVGNEVSDFRRHRVDQLRRWYLPLVPNWVGESLSAVSINGV